MTNTIRQVSPPRASLEGRGRQATEPREAKYRLAIFDFDGTLFDTRGAITHSIRRTFEQLGSPQPTADAISTTVAKGIGLDDTFSQLAPHLQTRKNELKDWVSTYRNIYKLESGQRVRPFGDARQLLSNLARSGLHIAVVSNKGVAAVNDALISHNLAVHISLVVGDTPGIAKKPDPMCFERIIKPHFGDEVANNVVMVGDTATDIRFARNIGAHACWARYGYGNADECLARFLLRISRKHGSSKRPSCRKASRNGRSINNS